MLDLLNSFVLLISSQAVNITAKMKEVFSFDCPYVFKGFLELIVLTLIPKVINN